MPQSIWRYGHVSLPLCLIIATFACILKKFARWNVDLDMLKLFLTFETWFFSCAVPATRPCCLALHRQRFVFHGMESLSQCDSICEEKLFRNHYVIVIVCHILFLCWSRLYHKVSLPYIWTWLFSTFRFHVPYPLDPCACHTNAISSLIFPFIQHLPTLACMICCFML